MHSPSQFGATFCIHSTGYAIESCADKYGPGWERRFPTSDVVSCVEIRRGGKWDRPLTCLLISLDNSAQDRV